jgi:ribosomal protein S7
VQKPIVETKWVDQAVTEMRPVTEQRTVNVPTVNYQTVTEYKQVQKQVGYWATKTESTNKIPACAYDNRPGVVGFMNRTGHDIRNAFTPNTKVSRTFVPQTMTCTVPTSKQVAVQGMKQVTYNVTSMVPQQTTRKVAVNTVRYVSEEVTAMKPVTVVKTMQVGTRISYAPIDGGVASGGSGNGGPTALTPTPETNARRQTNDRTANEPADELQPGNFSPKKISYPIPQDRDSDRGEVTETVIPSRPSAPSLKAPSVIRVSQWVARTPSSVPQPEKSTMSIAGNVR